MHLKELEEMKTDISSLAPQSLVTDFKELRLWKKWDVSFYSSSELVRLNNHPVYFT
jgi:hypothetical protein